MAVARLSSRTLALFARQGLAISGVAPIARSHRGNVLLATVEDGTQVRLRRFHDESAAARVHHCLQLAGSGTLPASLGRAGAWLATSFIEGTPLATRRRTSNRYAGEAARLLARIHASPRPRQAPPAVAMYARVISLATGRLARLGRIPPDVRLRLGALPRPTRVPAGLTHGDFSPDNLIVTTSGRLAVVDEERVAVRPLAYDLARAVCLWQFDRPAERRFLAAYARAGGDAAALVERRDFWIAAALATSVLYRLRYRPEALSPVVAALGAL